MKRLLEWGGCEKERECEEREKEEGCERMRVESVCVSVCERGW